MRCLTELKKECMNRVSVPVCDICGEVKPKCLTIHHLDYHPDSITYNKFGNSDDERLKYYSHLLDEIKMRPDNFKVLCIGCHTQLEYLLSMSIPEARKWIYEEKLKGFLFEGKPNPYIKQLERVWIDTLKARGEYGVDEFFWS